MKKKYFLLITVISVGLTVGCAKAPSGFAPGTVFNPGAGGVGVTSGQNILKIAQGVTTSNGWYAILDTTDLIEHKTTSSGWTIEVNHE